MNAGRVAIAGMLSLGLLACAGKRPKPVPESPSKPASTVPAHPVVAKSAPHHDDVSKPQSQRYRQSDDSGPPLPPGEIAALPEPVPRVEPRARYGNKSPYTVRGKTYRVLDDHAGYVERGIASWYGAKFHGYMTSSMEPYDMLQFSAAHKSLPLPSYARVTNLDNGKSVVVRVNDRGPFHDGRIIDLSYAAAVRIGVWPKGTARVEVTALDPRGNVAPRQAVAAPLGKASSGARLFLQAGAFANRDNAARLVARIKSAGVDAVGIDSNARGVHRVRIGPLADAEAIDAMTRRLERHGLGTPQVVADD